MSKELIVSVNGREKKIAIIDDGRVTEFYIERGEGSEGIVGNIYKGRVMRVLPGMQSAFVDIGLERDAFLYVSDFFDEEEEFERIVIDKAVIPPAREDAVGPERTRQADRGKRVPSVEAVEASLTEFEEPPEEFTELPFATDQSSGVIDDDDLFSDASEIDTSAGAGQTQVRNEAEPKGRRRSRRRGRGDAATEAVQTDKASGELQAAAETMLPEVVSSFVEEEISTPFVSRAGSFERVVDTEASAAEDGEMLKDAMRQERILDEIHAVEFDIQAATPAAVGSLLSTEIFSSSSFQRVDDSDVVSEAQPRTQEVRREPITARPVAAFLDAPTEESTNDVSASSLRSFERVSDDEVEAARRPVESSAPVTETPAPRGSQRGRRTSPRRGAEAEEEAAMPTAAESVPEAATEALTEPAEETPKTTRANRSRAASTAKRAPASKTTTARGGSGSRRVRRTESDEATGTAATDATSSAADGVDGAVAETADADTASNQEANLFEDREARITAPRERGEFARRGGRRRRRGGKAAPEPGSEEERVNGPADNIDETIKVQEPIIEVDDEAIVHGAEANSAAAPRVQSGRAAVAARAPRESREPREPRESRERRDRQPPTITDLMREGQEILVQIAKEPIAQKGARITSHIALPGRFLVYMPTIEHVGVSRKIESDSERVRLRKLIQLIRREEDVPSGGFIVRTAGTGTTEADLREDARYLVRTWRDIRRSAERAKSPALVHRDLDLVQRILRDQVSDDFTAIRVDSEEEYLGIVEFVNRIQPNLVKRVKLYTREVPILEAYGVQAEIEKAIKPRVWLRSGGYLVINQTEALVAIDVNTGKFVGRGGSRLEDTITRTNLEAVEEIARQIRLRDLGGIIVLDLIDMEERRNRQRVMTTLQDALRDDKSPTKVLSFNDFGLVIMTRKRVKQSLERTLCSPCPYCQGSSLVKSPQTICYEILEEARRLSRSMNGDGIKQTMLRLNPEVARALQTTERDVMVEIEDYLGSIDVTSDPHVHQEQFDFAFL